jgi:hypothetical protein
MIVEVADETCAEPWAKWAEQWGGGTGSIEPWSDEV